MSRDEFALAAMVAIIRKHKALKHSVESAEKWSATVAVGAYAYADAMLEARK